MATAGGGAGGVGGVESLIVAVKCRRCGGQDKPRLQIHLLASGKGHGEYRCQDCQAFNEITLSAKELEEWRIKRQKNILRNSSMMSEMEDLKDEDFDLIPVTSVRKSYQIHYTCANCQASLSPIVQLTIDAETGDGSGSNKCIQCLFRNDIVQSKEEISKLQELVEDIQADIVEKLPGDDANEEDDEPKQGKLSPKSRTLASPSGEDKPATASEEKVSKQEAARMVQAETAIANSSSAHHQKHPERLRLFLMARCTSCDVVGKRKFKLIEEHGKKEYPTSFKCDKCLRRTNVTITDELIKEYKGSFPFEMYHDPDEDEEDDMTGETGGGLVTISKLVDHVADAAELVDVQIRTVKGHLSANGDLVVKGGGPASPSREIPIEPEVDPRQGSGCGCFGGGKKK
eukprot:TRINITY_DN3332_c0_g1_i1.p1 TRINITY_DN3332_c0_g1~~TRINITY_DN3332_c0_g1_i1.p1  ORF type:complete len:401 (+),score=120.07 TRINITY_DN3332_c0_g1_i1:17-1219(+)